VTYKNHVLERYQEIDENKQMIECNNFIIQCVRIPAIYEFSLIKLMQVAYNIDQLYAIGDMDLTEFNQMELCVIETDI